MTELVHFHPMASMAGEMLDPEMRNHGEYERFLARKRFTPVVAGFTEVPAQRDSWLWRWVASSSAAN